MADQPWNTFIEGDNLDVLPTLEAEFGEVDLVYIDPPYNTGNEFAYRDDIRGRAGRQPARGVGGDDAAAARGGARAARRPRARSS